MRIECYDKKYTWIFNESTGILSCDRYGEKWRNATGDGAVLALMQEYDILEKKLKATETIIARAKNCIVCYAISDDAPMNTLRILEEYGAENSGTTQQELHSHREELSE